MPMPVRMKPICETEEQASVRFRLMENRASTAPSTIVTVPRMRIKVPHFGSDRNRLQVMAATPKMPDFVRTPDKSAEAGAGATGCAFGSQI